MVVFIVLENWKFRFLEVFREFVFGFLRVRSIGLGVEGWRVAGRVGGYYGVDFRSFYLYFWFSFWCFYVFFLRRGLR